jgi:hypothetical protein
LTPGGLLAALPARTRYPTRMPQLSPLARLTLTLACVVVAAACSANPPPRWAEGGAPLVIGAARWDRPDDDTIEILDDGTVLEDGDKILMVDRAGRVVDEDHEPVAILLPDGHVGGPDNLLLGRVGVSNAAPPGSAAAWLAILPNGQVVRFDAEGEQEGDGVWYGCDGPKRRTCTLITHVLAVRYYREHPRSGVTFGVGVGVGL